MIQVAVDAYGGDFAPDEVIKGVRYALKEKQGLFVYLVGKQDELEKLIGDFSDDLKERVEIVNADEIVRMSDKPSQALRMKNSSMSVGIKLVKEGKARAFMTAGNSGAAMAVAMFNLGRIKGVSRPAIATLLPTLDGQVMLIDAGANVDCKPQHLVEFAIMGAVYVKYVVGVKNPKIGVLSNGSEPGKGNQLTLAAYDLLYKSRLNFIGNVEGDEIYKGKADVVVSDGFVGNVVLKVSESVPHVIAEFLREEIRKSFLSKLGFLLAKSAFKALKKKTDYAEFGGAPLLGVNGACVISHGRSNAIAIKNAILKALRFSEEKVNDKIESALKSCLVLKELKGVVRS
ncbi:phosphate acyltransferase PlsX [Hippea alviniae]|uniref:phosphate acyltransferase PlsX n=1 Tax=Hippea alviniae TaxID=1279027 RepID=UPI0003B58ACB|nr:phosphate acyltransferase PlsX [Hippea alviniae]